MSASKVLQQTHAGIAEQIWLVAAAGPMVKARRGVGVVRDLPGIDRGWPV